MRLWLLISALCNILVFAQTGPQASKVPLCVRPCDTKAIATTTCTNIDILCHCKQQDLILASIAPCVLSGSNCTSPIQDLLTFESLFAEVCAPYNISVPTNTTSFPLQENGTATSSSGIVLAPSMFSSGGGKTFGVPWMGVF